MTFLNTEGFPAEKSVYHDGDLCEQFKSVSVTMFWETLNRLISHLYIL